MNYAKVRDGKVLEKRVLAIAKENGPQEIPQAGRFHVTPNHRLFVIYYVNGSNAEGKFVSENRIVELLPDGTSGQPINVPLKNAFNSFFTATPRGGSPLNETLDLLGTQVGKQLTISYARIRVTP